MMKGIDVSNANGPLDWEKIKKAGIEFAVVRSSYGSYSPDQIDRQFRNNAKGCIRCGIDLMTYHFAYFINVQKAKDEADFAIKMAKEYPQIRSIALDVEEDSERYAREMGASPDWTECCLAFLERVRSAGYTPVIYTNQDWMNNKLDFDRLKKYDLWLAAPDAPESVPKRYPETVMWQYSWTGHISGLAGVFDMDYCYDGRLFSKSGSGGSSSQKPKDEISQIHSSQEVNFDVKVTADDGVNIRSGAGTSYKILGAVPCGCTVHISRMTSDTKYSWGLTEYDGTKGWIALNFTQKCARKTVDQLAQEVINGDWGVGDERERLLQQAGYDYQAVQNRVNKILS